MQNAMSLVTMWALCVSAAGADDPVGWRGSGLGVYPQAEPPTEGSTTINVVWKTPLRSWSNASPVVLADRVFVCDEPNELVCVRKRDGKELWRRAVPLADTFSDADRAVAEAKRKETEALKKRYQELDDEINRLYQARRKDPDNQKLRADYKARRAEQGEVRKQISRNARWAPPRTESANGYTSPTPVSDGRHVWALMGTGVAACFDMAGNRKWIQFVQRPKHHEGHSASPVLAGGKLLLHINALKAYDPLTGQLLWDQPGVSRAWGTGLPMRIGETQVVVLPKREVVRVADGKVLVKNAGYLEYASPIVVDGVAYFIENNGRATRLTPQDDGGLRAEQLWTTTPKKDRYYASALLNERLLYAITRRGVLSVIDAKTGGVLHAERLSLGKGDVYPSITLAGALLYVGCESGAMAVIRPGREPKVIAVNRLEGFRCSPVFEGRRMYLRTQKHLFCIGE
jgi:outer membrane protein assembly factor BamB